MQMSTMNYVLHILQAESTYSWHIIVVLLFPNICELLDKLKAPWGDQHIIESPGLECDFFCVHNVLYTRHN